MSRLAYHQLEYINLDSGSVDLGWVPRFCIFNKPLTCKPHLEIKTRENTSVKLLSSRVPDKQSSSKGWRFLIANNIAIRIRGQQTWWEMSNKYFELVGSYCVVERAVGGILISDLPPSSSFVSSGLQLSCLKWVGWMRWSRVSFCSEIEILMTEVEWVHSWASLLCI